MSSEMPGAPKSSASSTRKLGESEDPAVLLKEGTAAGLAGDVIAARRLLSRATELAPLNANAWRELASVVDDPEEKATYLNKVLELDPQNEQARMGLERLQPKLEEAKTKEATGEVLYCTWHPDRETLLRCNRCGKPMCTECAVRHPVGLRCKECAQLRKSPVYQISAQGLVLSALVGLPLSVVAALIAPRFGFFVLFIAAFVGGAIADLMSRVAGYKQGPNMQALAAICIGGGALLVIFFTAGFNIPLTIALLFRNPYYLIYAGIAAFTAIARLK